MRMVEPLALVAMEAARFYHRMSVDGRCPAPLRVEDITGYHEVRGPEEWPKAAPLLLRFEADELEPFRVSAVNASVAINTTGFDAFLHQLAERIQVIVSERGELAP